MGIPYGATVVKKILILKVRVDEIESSVRTDSGLYFDFKQFCASNNISLDITPNELITKIFETLNETK